MPLPTAVIVGMESNGLGVSRALAPHGIPCIGLATPHWTPSCLTNSCRVVQTAAWTEEGVVDHLVSIGEGLDQKAPLLVTKDEPVLWISRSRERLSRYYAINLPDAATVDLLMDKSAFLDAARQQGWPVPRTWRIDTLDDLHRQLGDITFPSILKPRVKNEAFRKNAAQKAFRLESRDQLLDAYALVAQWEEQVVVQEWVGGPDARLVFCLTYYDRDGAPSAIFPGRKLLVWPLDCGNTAVSEPIREPALAESLTGLTESIFRAVGFRGLGSIEYKLRTATAEPVIMEPTVGRTNYQNELAVINGCNLPALAYCDLAGIEPFGPVRSGRATKLVDGHAQWRALFARSRLGTLRPGDVLAIRRGRRRYMLLRLGDVRPFLGAVGASMNAAARGMLRSLLGPTLTGRLKHLARRNTGAAR